MTAERRRARPAPPTGPQNHCGEADGAQARALPRARILTMESTESTERGWRQGIGAAGQEVLRRTWPKWNPCGIARCDPRYSSSPPRTRAAAPASASPSASASSASTAATSSSKRPPRWAPPSASSSPPPRSPARSRGRGAGSRARVSGGAIRLWGYYAIGLLRDQAMRRLGN